MAVVRSNRYIYGKVRQKPRIFELRVQVPLNRFYLQPEIVERLVNLTESK